MCFLNIKKYFTVVILTWLLISTWSSSHASETPKGSVQITVMESGSIKPNIQVVIVSWVDDAYRYIGVSDDNGLIRAESVPVGHINAFVKDPQKGVVAKTSGEVVQDNMLELELNLNNGK